MGGEGVFGLWEFAEAKLVDIKIPSAILSTFPGPAYGSSGVRKLTDWPDDEPAFGTILKPTAGITDDEVARLVERVVRRNSFYSSRRMKTFFPLWPIVPWFRGRAKRSRSFAAWATREAGAA